MLQVRNDLINLDNIKKIDDYVEELEQDSNNIIYVSVEEAKDFDLDNQRVKELRNSTSLTHFGLHLIQCGGKIKKPVTLVIRKNKRKQVISGHNRHDRFISDANKGWPDMPTIQIPIEDLVALGVSDKDLHAWGATQNPQLDPDLSDPMKKADLVSLVKKYCVRDLRVQEALAKDYLTQEHRCAKAYATEIIRVAKKELSRKAYENDTGKILVSWTDYKLKKKVEDFEKDTERAKGIYSTTGKFALETICRELIKNVKTKKYDTITVFYYHPTPEHLLEWKGGKKTEYEEILGILEDKFKVSINMIPLAFEKDKIDLSEDFS